MLFLCDAVLRFCGPQFDARMKRVSLKVDRIKYWLSVGAQPSETVGRLLGASGLLPIHPRVEIQAQEADNK